MKVTWIVELLMQLDEEGDLGEVFVAPPQSRLDQTVSEPESRGRETISHRRVDCVIVSLIESLW